MASSQIKSDSNAFLTTKAKQDTIITAMKNLADKQQSFFLQMANAWLGGSGAAFRAGITELEKETAAGIFMIQTLNNQTTAAHSLFLQADRDAANQVGKLTGRK